MRRDARTKRRRPTVIAAVRSIRVPRRRGYFVRLGVMGLAFTLPALLFFIAFDVFPLLYAVALSFTDFDLFREPRFVGLRNYMALLTNRDYLSAVGVTLLYTAAFGSISCITGFAFALLLKERLPGRGVFRGILYVPTVLSIVAVATAWSVLLRLEGPINAVLGTSIPWLTSQQWALPGVVLMSIWHGAGWYMVVFLAGLQSIPVEYYEGARIDGAGRGRLLWHITLPLLRPVLAFVAITTVVTGMKVFAPLFILTGGGPGNATRSISMLIYQEGLLDFRIGSAAAMSVVGFVFLLSLTVFQLRLFRVREEIGA